MDVKSDVTLAPSELEVELLRRANRQQASPTLATTSTATNKPAESGGDAVGYVSKWGNAIAVGDLQGQTAPEPDWYDPNNEFVCMHCLLPARGLVFGNPVGAEKTTQILHETKTGGRTVWVVRGRFGSPSCALRYMNDHRYSFAQETMGLLPLMLIRAYAYKGQLTDIPLAPARVELPPFQPALAAAAAPFDGIVFHDELNKNLKLQKPNVADHLIVSDHCALLVDAQVNRDKLPINIHQLRQALPNLFTKPRPNSRKS